MLIQNNVLTAEARTDSEATTTTIPEESMIQTEESDVQPEVLNEIEERRDTFSKEYLLSDNSRVLVVYPQPIHYETEEGNLAEIDNSLTETEEGYTNGNNSYEVVITDNTDSQGEVIYREEGYEIAWQMMELAEEAEQEIKDAQNAQKEAEKAKKEAEKEQKKAEKQAEKEQKKAEKEQKKAEKQAKKLALRAPKLDAVVTDTLPEQEISQENTEFYQPRQSAVTFDGYSSGVKVEYQPTGDGIKENIILDTRESGNEYIFCVQLSGLKAELNSNNEIVFYDEETDEIKYYFPAPFMIDSEGTVSYGARYELIDAAPETETAAETEPTTETEPEAESEQESKPENEAETESGPESEPETQTQSASEATTETGAEPETEAVPATEETTETKPEPATESETEQTVEAKALGMTAPSNESADDNQGTTTPETQPESEPVSEPEEESSPKSESTPETESASESEPESETAPQGTAMPETQPQENIASEIETDSALQSTFYLKITLDKAWLDQASYPVTVDPVLKQARAKNLSDYGCVASNSTTYDTLYAGKNSTAIYRSYIRFDLPDMEPQSIISEAKLQLGGTKEENNTHYLKATIITQDWYNKTARSSARKLSWSTQPALGSFLDYTVNAGYFNITKAIRAWQSGEQPNYGIAITAYDETTSKRDALSLKNSATVPYLTITYRTATGLESYWNTHTTAAGTAGYGYINDYTGALTVVNTDLATAGLRLPMTIRHIYNSNAVDENAGWRLNYAQTIKIPLDTVNVNTYPYVYTDEDGTAHYFKKTDVTYLLNAVSKEVLSTAALPPARDEDGLGLYIVPVTDTALKDKYPLKLIDKSASLVRYFDTFGRLALITDSNQYENTKNKATKEQNAITITYQAYGNTLPLTAYDEAINAAQSFRDTCYASATTVGDSAYTQTQDTAINAINTLKKDPYATADYKTAKYIQTAATEMGNLTDTTKAPTKATAKTAADAILNALKKAKPQAQTLTAASNQRIQTITDAVGNTARFTYDASGRITAITDPTSAGSGSNRYTYDSQGNLTQITYADGKTAAYTYDALHRLTSQRDHDGYRIEYTYRNADNRVIKVQEYHNTTPGQTYTIAYHTDNTTAFRYSGVDDIYGTGDDIENIHVFDAQGRTTCIYSKAVNENKILGATACTYEADSDNTNKRNKIKDTAVIGMHTNNLLKNHSFEYNDQTWSTYKNTNQTPESGALSTCNLARCYIGTHCAYVNLSKRTGGTAGFSQQAKLAAGTYTLSAYCSTRSIQNTAAYLKVTDAANHTYTSTKITTDTDPAFDNGWERLSLTFTINTSQTVTVCLETDCGTSKGAGTVAFDCVQLETGDVPNDYNILEDGSFDLTTETLSYKWKNLDNSTITIKDQKVTDSVDGTYAYHITGQPGKNKYLRFTADLGNSKNSYTLSGWIKADASPARASREFQATAIHKETDTDGETVEYKATTNLNAYTEGWQYFCLLLPAKTWKSTDLTICFYDNIGELTIDGLQLTRNDVQTKTYDSEGKVISRYTAQKTATTTYDTYNRTKKQTTASGASTTITYDTNNDIKQIAASIGPDTYYTYDKYGNPTSVSAYDPNTVKLERYTQIAYTADGNFKASDTDPAGNKVSYTYNTRTGQMTDTTLPQRPGDKKAVTTKYEYDTSDRIIEVTQGTRHIKYQYGEFDDLTAIEHNGFTYRYTYDGFGNVLTTAVAGTTLCTYEYAPNNGTITRTTLADGTIIRATYDVYGNLTAKTIDNKPVEQYTYDNRGNLARKIDRQANLTTTYDYNDTGKLVRSAVYTGDTATQTPESRMQYTYTKGGNIGTLSYQEKGDTTRTYTYEYATDDKPTKATLPDKSLLTYSYDSLRRSNKTVYTPKSGVTDAKKLYTTLQYQPSQFTVDGKTRKTTTDLVSTYTNKFGSSGTPVSEFTYTYDAWGNITNIKDQSARQKTYTYNEYGEITKATEAYANAAATTYTYTYDEGGNIKSETRGSTRHSYTYDNVWKDKLIAYDDETITYDKQGRPTNYLGKTMTWDNIGHLTAIDNTSNGTIRYTYLSDGQRHTKTVNGKTTTYHYNNGLLLSEQTGDETLRYYYDATGKVTSFTYKKGSNAEVSYFYTRNLQGDIIAIYRNSDSKLIGTYEYDLWGRLVSETEVTKGIDTDGILAKNPFRYRGYYYDTETGFYNLSARYYDPEIRRFISPDDMIASVGTSVQGHNLFAYCFNNPVNMADPSGHWPTFIKDKIIQPIEKIYTGITEDINNFDIHNTSEKKVLESNYFSSYKGVPTFRIEGQRSGSFGAMFISTSEPVDVEDIVQHEYGHTQQLKQLGAFKYALCIGLPSWQKWGSGEYYDKPWEITADIYGGVESRTHSQDDIEAGFAYLDTSEAMGPLVWLTIN
ncbi:MAG: DNRLRE domain-containing protein [Acetatifactor sp.]|nr:DNRLRE domain-containing protein [Acetatifactor sp.]